jgi:hypothetical protein
MLRSKRLESKPVLLIFAPKNQMRLMKIAAKEDLLP